MPKGYPRQRTDHDADGIEMPTAGEVARWKAANARIQAQIAGLSAKSEQLVALIAAAEPLIIPGNHDQPKHPKPSRIKAAIPRAKKKKKQPKKAKPAVEATPELPLRRGKQRGPATWPSVIHNILVEAGRPLTHAELRAELEKSVLADRLAKSDKGFYGGIAKLAEQDPPRLMKHKGRMFDTPVYKKFMADVAAGMPDLEDLPQIGNASPFRDAILDLMKSTFSENGVSSTDLIAELKKNPALAGTVQRHPTHTYNVLARLLDHGELTKWNEKYFLGPKQKAA